MSRFDMLALSMEQRRLDEQISAREMSQRALDEASCARQERTLARDAENVQKDLDRQAQDRRQAQMLEFALKVVDSIAGALGGARRVREDA